MGLGLVQHGAEKALGHLIAHPSAYGKASRGWGQALASPVWWEGERRWHLLKRERFRLEISNEPPNPCEDHEALERVALRGGGIPEPGGLQDLSVPKP